MRADFGKVVIESPRRGSRNKNKRTRERVNTRLWESYEDAGRDNGWHRPMHIGSGRWHRSYLYEKEFSDNLGPLTNFMRKMVGHHYNEAHSALCSVLPNNNEPMRHIVRDHFAFRFDHARSCWVNYQFWLDEQGVIHETRLHPMPVLQPHVVPVWWVPLPPDPPKPVLARSPWMNSNPWRMGYRSPAEHKPASCEKCRAALREHNERHIPARRLARLYSSSNSK